MAVLKGEFTVRQTSVCSGFLDISMLGSFYVILVEHGPHSGGPTFRTLLPPKGTASPTILLGVSGIRRVSGSHIDNAHNCTHWVPGNTNERELSNRAGIWGFWVSSLVPPN